MIVPHDAPVADKSFWHSVRCDETLRDLWSIGRGNRVPTETIARYMDMNVKATADWMESNGSGLWERDPEHEDAWLPLIGKSRRQ